MLPELSHLKEAAPQTTAGLRVHLPNPPADSRERGGPDGDTQQFSGVLALEPRSPREKGAGPRQGQPGRAPPSPCPSVLRLRRATLRGGDG